MSEAAINSDIAVLLGEECQERLKEGAYLFMDVWHNSLQTYGRTALLDGSVLYAQRLDREPTIEPKFILNHEYREPAISEDGALFEAPVATKYVLFLAGAVVDGDIEPLCLGAKSFDLTEERTLEREVKYDMTDPDFVVAFLEPFIDKKLGESALREKKRQKEQRRAELRYHRDQDLPEKPGEEDYTQLTNLKHFVDLLHQAKQLLPGQVIEADMRRDSAA